MTTKSSNPMGYTIIDADDRVTIIDDSTSKEICGAYQPVGHEYWSLYVTKLVTEVTGLVTPPHREHFYGGNGRCVARRWAELIGALYCMAAHHDRCAYPKTNGCVISTFGGVPVAVPVTVDRNK